MYTNKFIFFAFFLLQLVAVEMVFLSQIESYLKDHKSEVTSCKKNGSHYLVECEDTIFFPTGGGQHCDKGTLGGAQVLDVYRDGIEAIHVVDKEFSKGELLDQIIDWPHRFDQMQQHTGQHLLSAIIDKMYNFSTEAWDCGPDVCNVELDTKNKEITDKEMTAIEDECNKKIVKGVEVHAAWYKPDDPELKKAHTRGLPKDHEGLVRMVTIDGIDDNLCCGTHVRNLHELQVLKLLKTTKAPKGRYLLHFIVGNRVLRKLKETYDRERELSALIKGNPENLFELVKKNIELSRKQHKYLGNVLKDMAILEARAVRKDSPYTFVVRREGDMAYANCYLREFQKQDLHPDAVLVIITGEGPDGNIVVYKKSGNAEELGKLVCDAAILDGVGKGRDTQFSGKVKHPERHVKANDVIKKHLKL